MHWLSFDWPPFDLCCENSVILDKLLGQTLSKWGEAATAQTAEEDHYFATQVTPAAPLSGARSKYSVERCSITEGGNVC